jgi:hypothetical protein
MSIGAQCSNPQTNHCGAPRMTKPEVMAIKGEVQGFRWEAKYVRPELFAITELRVWDPSGQLLPRFCPSDSSYRTEQDMRAAIEKHVVEDCA